MKQFLQAFLAEKPFFFAFIRPKEASLYQPYKPFKKPILDLGCGDGFFAQVAFGTIDAGIDPDEKATTEAKQRNVYKEIKPYDGKRIPYPDNYFATVVCNSTFEHITNIDQVLHEVARVLKKGGVLYFTVPTDRWPTYLLGSTIIGKSYETYFNTIQRHYNLYSFEKWKTILDSLGLCVVDHTFYLDNKTIIWLFDLTHYISIPSLITKRLFNRWVLFPKKVFFLNGLIDYIAKKTAPNTKKGSCVFIATKKI